jgi:hypothetical protein
MGGSGVDTNEAQYGNPPTMGPAMVVKRTSEPPLMNGLVPVSNLDTL